MEQENKKFIHDTINLEEIRDLLQPEQPEQTPAVQLETPEEPAENAAAEEKKPKGIGYELYGMLHDLIYILVAVTLVFVFLVRLVGVDGKSMLPTLHHRDFLLLESNFLYGPDDIQNGDIVVLNVPYYEGELIVKRVIATEGQTVDIDFEKGEVYVDGELLQEDYINEPTTHNWSGEYALEYPATVPEGCIFVLGDNRNSSNDSRFAPIGMIEESCVLGKALAIVLPGQTVDERGTVTDPRDWSRIGFIS